MHIRNLFLFVLGICTLLWTEASAVGSPIVLVPGVLGSRLEGKLNNTLVSHFYCPKNSNSWITLWLSLVKIIPPGVYCLSDYLKLKYEPSTGEYINNDGVETRVPDFGNTSSIEYLDPGTEFWDTTDYFSDMVKWFVDKGYTRGKDIVGAPYDWRYSPNGYLMQGYYANLKKLIENTYHRNNHTRVVLVAHSMGSPNTLYFLTKFVDQPWKDKYIHTYVTISGVWHGASQSIKAVISGNNDNIFIEKDIWTREIQRSFPANFWLVPFPSETWTTNDVLVVTPKRNYTAWDYKDLFNDLEFPRGWEMYGEVKGLTNDLPAPNVTMYCFYGNSHNSTPVQFVYGPGEFPNKDPSTVIKGDGDQTVNIKSLMACSKWKGQQTYDVTLREFPDVEHLNMVKNKDVLKALDDIVFSPDTKLH